MVEDRDPPRCKDPHANAPAPRRVEASALFEGRDEIRLMHRGQEYRLRITRQGKLILTK